MTYSNGTYSAHPLANPFNTLLGPANYSLNQFSVSYIKQINAKNKSLPDPVMLGSDAWQSQQFGNDLHVPQSYVIQGNNRNSDLFECSDGTLLDIKTGKVVHDPNVKFQINGYWNDPNTMTNDDSRESEWTDEQIYSLPDRNSLECNLGISRKDQEYWNNANIESNKLLSAMTNTQKQMLAEIDQIFPASKLEEVQD